MRKSLILVGCGNMGFAMLEGWVAAGIVAPDAIHVVEPTPALRQRAAGIGVEVHETEQTLPTGFEPGLIIFAVKPQVMEAVVPTYARFAKQGTTFLSVAAGTLMSRIEAALGGAVAIVRVMPNTPAAIGKGMMVICANNRVSPEANAFVEELMAASGAVAHVDDESQMDAVTAVSGSGPAYVFHMIEALRDAAMAAGLPEETAKLLAMQTVYGAACYARESGVEPGTLRQQVTSPNGTTAAALSVLMGEDRLKTLMHDAVEAARKRSVELAG